MSLLTILEMLCEDPTWANYTHANVSIPSKLQGAVATVQCHPCHEFMDKATTKTSVCSLLTPQGTPEWYPEITQDCLGKFSKYFM